MPSMSTCVQWDGCWEKYGATRRYLTKEEARRPPYLLSFPGLRLRPHVSELGNNRVDKPSRGSAPMSAAELGEDNPFLTQSPYSLLSFPGLQAQPMPATGRVDQFSTPPGVTMSCSTA